MKGLSRFCVSFTHYLYAIVIFFIMVTVTLVSPSDFSLTSRPYLFSNPVLLLVTVPLICIIFALSPLFSRFLKDTSVCEHLVLNISITALLLQFYLSCNYYFNTGWDVGELSRLVNELSNGNPSPLSHYLSVYPNNILLLTVINLCKRLNSMFGVIDSSNYAVSFIFLNCCISSFTGWLTYQNVKYFCDYRWGVLGFTLYWGLIGISPWVCIPYSDSLALAFPSLLLFLYTRCTPPLIIKWGAIGLFSGLAYGVKPQSFLIFIAIVIVDLCHIDYSNFRKEIYAFPILITAFIIAFSLPKYISYSLQLDIDSEQSFGVSHFLMMGINPDTIGSYSDSDVSFSSSFSTKDARSRADLEVFMQRVHDYGFFGYLKVLRDKTACDFNDGTFAWGREGSFWKEVYPLKNNFISPKIRSIYYEDGTFYPLWCTFAQFLWLFTLLFSMLSISQKNSNKALTVLRLTVCGLFLFEMLFETRARYIFTCVPLFIVLSIIGLREAYYCFLRITKKYPQEKSINE